MEECPVCLSPNSSIVKSPLTDLWYVTCGDCECRGQSFYKKENAIEYWNTRPARTSGKKIYALFNPQDELVRIGLNLESVTCHMDHSFGAKLWNALMESNDPVKEKGLLERAGWKVKTGYFNSTKKESLKYNRS